MRQSNTPLSVNVLTTGSIACLLTLVAYVGCSKPNGLSLRKSIPLGGTGYVSTYKHPIIKDSTCAGLANLSDINSDGFDDILIASSSGHRDSSSATPVGWVEAICGKTGIILWSVMGSSDKTGAGTELRGYFVFDSAHVIGDLDGDSIADVFALDEYAKKRTAWISGKTGKIIHLGEFAERMNNLAVRPVGLRRTGNDHEMLFLKTLNRDDPSMSLLVYGVPDLQNRSDVQFALATPMVSVSNANVLTLNSPDENGGQAEWLVQTTPNHTGLAPSKRFCDWRVICGQTFKELRSLRTEVPTVISETQHTVLLDLLGLGEHAVIVCSGSGAGTDGTTSTLRAVSLKDGSIIWNRSGSEVAGGASTFSVDKSGKTTELGGDVDFGSPVVVVDDVNGDQTRDVATTIRVSGVSGSTIAVFSGKDGAMIRTLDLSTHNVSDSLITLRRNDQTELAALGSRLKTKQLELLILNLK